MQISLFPAMPNTRRVRELKSFLWDVDVSGRRLVLGFHDRAPIAELRLPKGEYTMRWQGDVLSLSDRGEFALAMNRGLVVSVETERLILPGRKLDREARTVMVYSEGDCFLVYFEWGDKLTYRKQPGEDRVGVASPGAEWPLMLFIAHGPSPALADTELDRLKSVNMGEMIANTQSFEGAQPRLEMSERLDALWEHSHHLHRVNTYEPEPPFIFEWECATRTDHYASRVLGNWDTIHTVWDWLLIDATRARQEFENYLKSYDPETAQVALDVAPVTEDVWPTGPRMDTEGRCTVCSHPPLWPEIAWRLYLATNDRSWLSVTYEIAKLNIAWWETERDFNRDGLYEYADTRFPQPWESGFEGSPRFDDMTADGMACVDLNAQLVMFYRNLVRFAVELGEDEDAAVFSQRQNRLAHLVRERLYDAETGWFYDRGNNGLLPVRTSAGIWPLVAGIPTPEQTERIVAHLENAEEFATWFPLPSVAANEREFARAGWRGPARASQVLWLAIGLRRAGRVALAGRLIRRALDAMGEVLSHQGTICECYNPLGPDTMGLRLFDYAGPGDPARRYYVGHAPVRAMVLSGLLGVEPTRDGLLIDPAEASLDGEVFAEFLVGGKTYTLNARKREEGLETSVQQGSRTVATSYGKMLIPRGQLL
jgi:hypothetical protein